MFPIDGGNSDFTYDNLSEIRLDPFWTGVASIVTAGFLIVVTLAASGQPPVQADVPNADTAFVTTGEADDGVRAVP